MEKTTVFNIKARMGRKNKWITYPDYRVIQFIKDDETRHFIHKVIGDEVVELSKNQAEKLFLSYLEFEGLTIRASGIKQGYTSIPKII